MTRREERRGEGWREALTDQEREAERQHWRVALYLSLSPSPVSLPHLSLSLSLSVSLSLSLALLLPPVVVAALCLQTHRAVSMTSIVILYNLLASVAQVNMNCVVDTGYQSFLTLQLINWDFISLIWHLTHHALCYMRWGQRGCWLPTVYDSFNHIGNYIIAQLKQKQCHIHLSIHLHSVRGWNILVASEGTTSCKQISHHQLLFWLSDHLPAY